MPVLTFGVMAVVIAFIGGILFWAILSETELCKKGLNTALDSTADINHPAALAYTRAMVAAYTKTFSILLSFLLMFAGAMLWQLALPGGLVPGLSRPAGEVREGWLEGPGGRAVRPVAAPDKNVAQVQP